MAAPETWCEWSGLRRWLCPHCPEFGTGEGLMPFRVYDRLRRRVEVVEAAEPFDRQWSGLASRQGKAQPLRVVCDHDPETGAVCLGCAADVALVLGDVPALLFDLDLALTRQVRFVEHGSLPGSDAERVALVWDDRAAKALARVEAAVEALAEALQVESVLPWRQAEQCRSAVGLLTHRPDGQALASRLCEAVARGHAVIDRPPSPWFYGACPECHHDLWAERMAADDAEAEIACPQPECAYRAPLAEHLRGQLDAGEDRWLTVTELVGAITMAGETVTRHQINGWIRREGLARELRVRPKLVRGSLQTEQVWVYRLGDVRRLARQAEERRTSAERPAMGPRTALQGSARGDH